MKSAILAAALAAGSASAGVLVVRDAATILSDISSIQGQVQSLATAVNGFSGITDTAGLQGLISSESALQTSIDKGTTDAKATSQLSENDASQILSAVKALIPDIVTALNAVVAKDPTFASAGVGTVVSGDLTSLKSSTDAFAAALIAIAPADDKDSANAAASCIDAAFSAAMATSSASDSCTSNIAGGGGSSPSSSAAPTSTAAPTSSAPGSTSTPMGVSTTASSSGSAQNSGMASSSSAAKTSSGAAAPTTTPVTSSKPTSTSGSGSASGTGVGPSTPMFSGAADSVKVGLSGAMAVAALALAL